MSVSSPKSIAAYIWYLPLLFVALFAFFFGIDLFLDLHLAKAVGFPRTGAGIVGIFLGAFVHGDLFHLFSNGLSFLILGVAVLFFYEKIGLKVFFLLYPLTGFGIWLFAHQGYHIGASGWLYGLAAFLFAGGIFRAEKASLMVSLAVAVLYSGLLAGILPTPEIKAAHISWEAHLIGLVIGFVLAFIYKDEKIRILQESEQAGAQKKQTAAAEKPTFGFVPLRGKHFYYTFKEKEK
ncbi:rhomboid family intramembrane serine protease [Hugenholtzia roseola]|uniref:rhomboid family intramembrane serine protease n=1 Tax=Hugenholtzia roseola TaxID=1002 RepID=UPI000409A0B4|nr:rhomboid family intramembrane serine protease [Hugenholtzia roseola]